MMITNIDPSLLMMVIWLLIIYVYTVYIKVANSS